jgi:hypothetical protein
MPDETPKLYSKPFIIEPHDSNSTLFGDINSIIGFYNDYEGLTPSETSMQMFNLLFHTTPKTNPQWYDSVLWLNKYILENKERKGNMYLYLAANLFYLRPFVNKGYWDFEFIDYNKNVFNEKKFCDNCIYRNSCGGIERQIPNLKYHLCVVSLYDNILSFITIFNYMLEVENSPIQAKQQIEHTTYMANKKGKVIEKHQDWIIKYIYLDKSKIKYEDKPEYSEFDKDSLVQKTVNVKGHLRHQAYGTGHKDHKWIYIESYVSKKWVKDGDTKIVVGLQK